MLEKYVSWNYRVVLHKAGCLETNPDMKWDEYLAIHEVYYDKDGKPDGMTKDAKGIMGDEGKDSLYSIKLILEQMMDSLKKPILDYDTLKEIDKDK